MLIDHQKIIGSLDFCTRARARMAYLSGLLVGPQTLAASATAASIGLSTSHAITPVLSMRRFTRLTNGFSKKVDNHLDALALYFVYYNFCRIHKTLRVTPAMAAGITDELMDMTHIVRLIDQAEQTPKKRGPYKKQGHWRSLT